jgi:hypothetical protein
LPSSHWRGASTKIPATAATTMAVVSTTAMATLTTTTAMAIDLAPTGTNNHTHIRTALGIATVATTAATMIVTGMATRISGGRRRRAWRRHSRRRGAIGDFLRGRPFFISARRLPASPWPTRAPQSSRTRLTRWWRRSISSRSRAFVSIHQPASQRFVSGWGQLLKACAQQVLRRHLSGNRLALVDKRRLTRDHKQTGRRS